MITRVTRQEMKRYIARLLDGVQLEEAEGGFVRLVGHEPKDGDMKPFHESLLPAGLIPLIGFERSFVTRMGKSFERCSRLVALDNHKRAENQYKVAGTISRQASQRIDEIVHEIDSSGMKMKYLDFVEEIVNLSNEGDRVDRENTVDLYLERNDGVEIYLEIKSPKPNKDQCIAAARKQLEIHSITYEKYPKVRTYFAFPYNPYGADKSAYNHGPAMKHIDLENEVLIGKEFWDLIGGEGTYEEVLRIYQEVGQENRNDHSNQMPLDFD